MWQGASELLLWARSLTSSSSTQPCQTPPTQCACSRRRRTCSRPPRLPLCAGVCGALPLFLPKPFYLHGSLTLIALPMGLCQSMSNHGEVRLNRVPHPESLNEMPLRLFVQMHVP